MKLPLKIRITDIDADIEELDVFDGDDNLLEDLDREDIELLVESVNKYPVAKELLKRISEQEPGRADDLHKEIVEFLLHS